MLAEALPRQMGDGSNAEFSPAADERTGTGSAGGDRHMGKGAAATDDQCANMMLARRGGGPKQYGISSAPGGSFVVDGIMPGSNEPPDMALLRRGRRPVRPPRYPTKSSAAPARLT